MKRSLSFRPDRQSALVVAGTALVAATYGLVRLAFGLFLPDLRASTAMGGATAGYVASAASIVYCVGALVGLTADRRPRLLVAAATTTAGAGALGTALAPGAAVLAAATVVGSAGAGLASPALVAVVRRSVGPARRDAAQSVVNSGTGPGLVAAGLLALALPSWRAAFVVSAVVTVVAGALVLRLDRPTSAAAAGRRRGRQVTGSVRSLAAPGAAALLLGASSAAVWTYGRTHLVDAGAGRAASLWAWVALGAGGLATVLTARRLARLGHARAWSLTAATSALATALLGLAPTAVLGPVACAAFGWAFVAATSALIAWAARAVPDRAAAGAALLFVALVAGQAVGSAGAGALGEGAGWAAAFVAAGAVALLAAPISALGSSRGTEPQ